MKSFPIHYLMLLIFVFLVGAELDVYQSFRSYLLTKAGLESATLAGATQQEQVITENSPTDGNAPIRFGYFLKQDGSPGAFASYTWSKNTAQWGDGPWSAITPSFTTSRKDVANTPADQIDTVSGRAEGVIPMTMSNRNFSMNAATTFVAEAASTVFNSLSTSEELDTNTVTNTIDGFIKDNSFNTIEAYNQTNSLVN